MNEWNNNRADTGEFVLSKPGGSKLIVRKMGLLFTVDKHLTSFLHQDSTKNKNNHHARFAMRLFVHFLLSLDGNTSFDKNNLFISSKKTGTLKESQFCSKRQFDPLSDSLFANLIKSFFCKCSPFRRLVAMVVMKTYF